ncbi:putative pectinesterase 55 [Camellia lanceoleosa]|uniref:Pectinesterase 55 n=1 Tax=Camellia lanceoleosa TaxID=1840588 RepID=A0ACC0IN74_9ERIC|nr:putative pectinesterase 55 [Camellia lanceoleosa]
MQIHLLTFIVFLLVSTCFGLSGAIECRVNVKNPSKYAYTITVDQTGKGNFVTIQKAVDSVPSNNDQWLRIHVLPGIYMENVTIPKEKQCIFLEGSGYTQTTISGEDHSQTDSSATFTALPDNFVAKGIAFMNSYNRPILVDEVKPAVAARIYGDKAAFYECAFLGFQDTLWDVEGRHYFNSCYIEGAIDFIWGDGQSFFEECRINVTAGLLPSQVSAGYITAQGRQSEEDPGGFVFENGYVFGTGQAYLGRAYRPYSRVIFHGTTLDSVVVPAGWDASNYQGHEENLTYAEIGCKGAGASTSKRVEWEKKNLDGSLLQEFSRDSFINKDGWLGNQPMSS